MAIEEVSRKLWRCSTQKLTSSQEFSIEIPDKEADAIHSGTIIAVQVFIRVAY
jgi:hypothetical protein